LNNEVSIIIPAWKADKWINDCLQSIYDQSWFKNKDNKWEILIGVDNCEDTKSAICPKGNTKIHYFTIHYGPYVIRNTLAYKVAKYKNLLFFDSDDLMHPDLIKDCFESNKELIFEIPESSKAGDVTINVEIYDYDYDRNKQNQQIEEMNIKVNQVPTSIIIGFSKQTISPEETLTLTSELKDQSGEEIKKELIIKIKSPIGEIEEHTLNSGGFVEIEFPSDATAGTWEVISYYNNNLESKLENFEVLKVSKLDYIITGGIVTVTNIGNALYEGNINISIGDHEKTFM